MNDDTITEIIREEFNKHQFQGPVLNAIEAKEIFDGELARQEITPENTRLGTIVCFDDISFQKSGEGGTHPQKNLIYNLTQTYASHMPLGNLGGMNLGGSVGIGALTHHVPVDENGQHGNLLIFAGAHTGYSDVEGFGKCIRPNQYKPSGNCGALVGYVMNIDNLEKQPNNPAWNFLIDAMAPYKEAIQAQEGFQARIVEATVSAHKAIIEQTKTSLAMANDAGVFDALKGVYLIEALQINTDKTRPDQYILKDSIVHRYAGKE